MDATTLRHGLGHFGSGITVVAGLTESGPVGFTCQSFCSLSLDPALVTFAPARTSTTWPLIRPLATFGITILADHQSAHSTALSRPGTDKFAGIPWRHGDRGAPILDDALATLECRLWAEYDGGDHTLVAAEVLALDVDERRAPLLYYRSAYAHVSHNVVI